MAHKNCNAYAKTSKFISLRTLGKTPIKACTKLSTSTCSQNMGYKIVQPNHHHSS